MKARILVGLTDGSSIRKPIKTISVSTKNMDNYSEKEVVEVLESAIRAGLGEKNTDILMDVFQEERNKIPKKTKDTNDKSMRQARKVAPQLIFKE